MIRVNLILAVCLLFGLVQPYLPAQQIPDAPEQSHPEAILVKYREDDASQPNFSTSLQQMGITSQAPVNARGRLYRMTVREGLSAAQAAERMSADPRVLYAEPDYIAEAALVPNDTHYASQWGLEKINAPAAWDSTTGSAEVIIAVIDSGIDPEHPDLAGKLWTNPGETANAIDDDSNGKLNDLHGWNFLGANNDLTDTNGHGTQVTGVIAAASNNGQGIAGVCWGCKIMPLKVMSAGGVANYSDIVRAVDYAVEKGADVINISLGGYSASQALKEAIDAAVAANIMVVAGAGNDNVATLFYPAAYDEVLAVAATTQTDQHSSFSNFGGWVDVSAPGEAIRTTFDGGDYGDGSGTSLSAPFVSGLAGLIRSRWPLWNQAMVKNQVLRTADAIDAANPGMAGQLGTGRINAQAAMQEPEPILMLDGLAVNGNSTGRPTPGEQATLAVTLRNDWQDSSSVLATLSTSDPKVTISTGTTGYGSILSDGKASGSFTFTPAADIGYSHAIPFHLSITAGGG